MCFHDWVLSTWAQTVAHTTVWAQALQVLVGFELCTAGRHKTKGPVTGSLQSSKPQQASSETRRFVVVMETVERTSNEENDATFIHHEGLTFDLALFRKTCYQPAVRIRVKPRMTDFILLGLFTNCFLFLFPFPWVVVIEKLCYVYERSVCVCVRTISIRSVSAARPPDSRVGRMGAVLVQLVSSVILLVYLCEVVHAQAAQLLSNGPLTLQHTQHSHYTTKTSQRAAVLMCYNHRKSL